MKNEESEEHMLLTIQTEGQEEKAKADVPGLVINDFRAKTKMKTQQ